MAIYKFEKNMLHGGNIHIVEKLDSSYATKHWHNYYEIIYYKKASGYCILNGQRREISDGSLFLLTPKDFHEVSTKPQEDSYQLIIAFNENMLDTSLIDLVTRGAIVYHGVPQRLADRICELYEVFCEDGRHREKHLYHVFNCIIFDLLKNASAVSESAVDISPIVRESISVMLSDPTADISLQFFAKKFNITEAYFSRLFHKHTGVAFKQYLTDLRLEYAGQLLEENKISVIDVGYECGFNTPSQFYRAFKKNKKMTPSEYRKAKKRG